MTVFPRVMITIAGAMLLAILVLAARRFFPAHVRPAETVGAALGVAVNVVLQAGLWSKPAASR
jgi:hypothetical protein